MDTVEQVAGPGGSRRGRRVALWTVAGVFVVVAAAAATLAALGRGPYSFLERFHPQHIEIDLMKLYPPGYKPPPGIPPPPPMTMLVFDDSQAGEVLAAMKRELTPGRGFTSTDLAKTYSLPAAASHGNPFAGETIWMFAQSGTKSGGPAATEGAFYEWGRMATMTKIEYTEGWVALTASSSSMLTDPTKEKPSCIVVVTHKDTWLQSLWAKTRSLLHLP